MIVLIQNMVAVGMVALLHLDVPGKDVHVCRLLYDCFYELEVFYV